MRCLPIVALVALLVAPPTVSSATPREPQAPLQPPAAPPIPLQTPATPPAPLQPPPTPASPAPPPRPPAPPAERGPRTSLDVQVVIVRAQGDQVLSRLPYSLEVTTNGGESQLNMGAEVPVPTTTVMPARPAQPRPGTATPPAGPGQPALPQGPPVADAPGAPAPPMQSMSYRSVGTVISCRAMTVDGGQYELTLSVDDTAVLPRSDAPSAPGTPALPAFRSFRTRNTLVLRDGQTRVFTVASDRVSGEVVRVEVGVKVVR